MTLQNILSRLRKAIDDFRMIENGDRVAVGLSGGFFAIKGMLTVGGFASFLAYSNQYTKPFNEISGVVTELQNALACAARLFELIDEKPEISDEGNTELETFRLMMLLSLIVKIKSL